MYFYKLCIYHKIDLFYFLRYDNLYSLSLFFLDEFISPFVIHGSLIMDLCGIVTSFSGDHGDILFSSLLIFSMKAL